jgi:HrpA-like RNA helicase
VNIHADFTRFWFILLQVILMSATMNCEEFARYFSLPVGSVLEPAPVVNVEGQVFKVSQFFADDLQPLGRVGNCAYSVFFILHTYVGQTYLVGMLHDGHVNYCIAYFFDHVFIRRIEKRFHLWDF